MNCVVVNVYESLLVSVKNHFNQAKRSSDEIKAKLIEIFDLNNAEFKKIARMYRTRVGTIGDRINYELQLIEDYKKRRYGENYAESNG